MEKACLAYVSLSDEQIRAMRPYADMRYSEACINRNYSVIVREKASKEGQFRTRILRMLRKLNINAPRLKRNWCQTLNGTKALEIITREPTGDFYAFNASC